jgi:hypothetical protein
LGQLIIPEIHDSALVSAYCAPLKPAKAARRAEITIVHSRRKKPPTEGALLFAFAPFALKVTDQLADPFASRAIALRHATGAGIALTGAQVPLCGYGRHSGAAFISKTAPRQGCAVVRR